MPPPQLRVVHACAVIITVWLFVIDQVILKFFAVVAIVDNRSVVLSDSHTERVLVFLTFNATTGFVSFNNHAYTSRVIFQVILILLGL